MKNKYIMNLFIFDDGDGANGSNGGNGNGSQEVNRNAGATFTYEQLNEIASSRAERAERAALKNYFSQAGLSEAEAQAAFEKYKADKKAQQPNVSEIEKERDGYKAKYEEMMNTNFLRSKGVHDDEMEFVMFKISKNVTDKKDFKAAAEEFLKSNPRYTSSSYRMSGAAGSNNSGSSHSHGMSSNDAIRAAARRKY